jgi:hypothetical protein
VIIFLYYSIDYLLLLAILILLYMFDGPEVIIVAASTWAAGTTFSGILVVISVSLLL